MALKAKHLAGWITSDNTKEPGWLDIWLRSAERAEAKEDKLVVLRVPASDKDAEEAVERFLQKRYPDEAGTKVEPDPRDEFIEAQEEYIEFFTDNLYDLAGECTLNRGNEIEKQRYSYIARIKGLRAK